MTETQQAQQQAAINVVEESGAGKAQPIYNLAPGRHRTLSCLNLATPPVVACYLGLAVRAPQISIDAVQVRCLLRVVGGEMFASSCLKGRSERPPQQPPLLNVQSIFHTCYLRGIFP